LTAKRKQTVASDPVFVPAFVPVPDERPVDKSEARALCGNLPESTFDRNVASGRLPAPIYPAPRSPRWYPSELRAAITGHRMLPAQAKEERRQARLTRERKQHTEKRVP
jgi:predicted DNA-binding transcriptional regulator AlpA